MVRFLIRRRQKCPKCGGTGLLKGKDIGQVECPDCNGDGWIIAPSENT